MIEFHGIVNSSGILTFPKPVEELRMRLLSEYVGKSMTERLFVSGRAGTSNQQKAHFGLAVAMIRDQMIDQGWTICGVAPNKDMIHEILSRTCGGVGEFGALVRFSKMTVEQRCKFFENIRDWAATQLHLVIPDPDSRWKEKRDTTEKEQA
jgi:hypothetical protein